MNAQEWANKRLELRRTTQHKITYRKWKPGEKFVKPVLFRLYDNAISIIPYGSPQRVYHRILFHSGCRPTETWFMDLTNIKDNILWWQKGKNQKGWRHAWLPDDLIDEIKFMMREYGSRGSLIFTRNANTLRREFNMSWRPLLCNEWNEKFELPAGMKQSKKWKKFADPFVFNLKGYRKTWVTVRLCQFYLEYKDWDIAMGQVRADMGHASQKMTTDHYVCCVTELDALQYARANPNCMSWATGQKVIMAYG